MDAYEYGELLKTLKLKIKNIENIVKPNEIKKRLKEIEQIQQEPNFWEDAKSASKISQEKIRKEKILEKYQIAYDSVIDAIELFDMAKSEGDEETLELLYDEATSLEDSIKSLEIEMMLSSEHDSLNAIISIHPGAGGTESQDWLVCYIECI